MSRASRSEATGPSGLNSIAMPVPASLSIAAHRRTSAADPSSSTLKVVLTHVAPIMAACSASCSAELSVASASAITRPSSS